MGRPSIYRRVKLDEYDNPVVDDNDKPVPEVGYPYGKQREILDYIFSSVGQEKIIKVALKCGIGFGKTTLAIDISQAMLSLGSEQRGLFLEPDVSAVNDIFLAEWDKIVPPELYKLNEGKRRIYWHNGAILYYGPRVVTGSQQAAADKYRGRNLTFIVDDEAAIQFNMQLYQNNLGRIRVKSPFRLYFTDTTPKLGEYSRYLNSPNLKVFSGTTYDNPYIDREWIEDIKENMSKNQARREIGGEMIALEGMAFGDFVSDKLYPEGNRHWATFDPDLPYFIAADIGLKSGYLIIQRHPATDIYGNQVGRGHVDVIVQEFSPNAEDTRSTCMRIKAKLPGAPVAFCTGADTETTANWVDGIKASEVVQDKELWPGVSIRYPAGRDGYKSTQYDRLTGLICNHKSRRQLLVSEKLVSHDKENRRGVLEVMAQDEFPDGAKRGEFLKKDGTLEHIRDALFYWAASMYRKTHN
jgi:hypothetical protein